MFPIFDLMKGFLLVIILVVGCQGISKKETQAKAVVASMEIPTYSFDEFKSLLYQDDSKTYVINFWATWCKPCIKELPHFEELRSNYVAKDVEVILVSLDFPEQVEKQLIPFIKRKNLQSKVVLLDDPDANSWIPQVSENWSGAIPATVIYNGKQRAFYERSFTYEELETQLLAFL